MTHAGASGGAIAAAQVAITEDPPGEAYCLVPAEPVEPRAVVMWEGDWVLGSWWDNALEANPSFYENEWVLNQLDADLESAWHVMAGSPEREGRYRYAINDPFGAGVDHTLTIIEGASHEDMTPEGREAYIDFIVNG